MSVSRVSETNSLNMIRSDNDGGQRDNDERTSVRMHDEFATRNPKLPRTDLSKYDHSKAHTVWFRAEELFIEACSTLYNEILDAADLEQEISEESFLRRQMEVATQGAQLADAVPQLSNIVIHKLGAVNRAMEHLKIRRRSSADGCTKEDRELSALSTLRKWLHSTNEKLAKIEGKCIRDRLSRNALDRLAADQQVLQLQIETEGHTLVQNIERSLGRSVQSGGSEVRCDDRWESRVSKHLKALTQRWHEVWLRSLSLQYRIEKEIERLYQSEEDSESDPELREPVVKRRRTLEGTITCTSSDDPLRSEDDLLRSDEDTIPFAEHEYERISDSGMPLVQSLRADEEGTLSYSEKEVGAIETLPDVGYSSGENSMHEALNEISGLTTTEMEGSDCERRLRIESSPVKSFYRTVPLDDAGVTDTETPRNCVSSWPYKFTNNILTDSLIVNTEEEDEVISNNDMREVLALLDDEEDKDGCTVEGESMRQGTKWQEFRSGGARRNCYRSNCLECVETADGKNSCDASSEESDDLPREHLPPSVVELGDRDAAGHSSLKRRHRQRGNCGPVERTAHPSSALPPPPQTPSCPPTTHSSTLPLSFVKSSFNPLGFDLETSVCSNYSQAQSEVAYESDLMTRSFYLPPVACSSSSRQRHVVRRKLRARRLPRSMSDGEQLGNWMNSSTHSAPGASGCHSMKLRDSDATAPEQSDAPPYEWDDYNPPAKVEDDWGYEERQDASALTLDDDFQIHLGDHLRSIAADSRTSVHSAASSLSSRPVRHSMKNLRSVPKSNSERLTATVPAQPRMRFENLDDLDDMTKGWNAMLTKIDSLTMPLTCEVPSEGVSHPSDPTCLESPLPAILSKIEKFASSLKLIQDDDTCSSSSLCSLSSIRSFDDVVSTLKIFNDIHKRLVEEREELRSLLNSDTFTGAFSSLLDDFEPLASGYEEAIDRVEQLMAQIEKVRESWSDWAETQSNLRSVMVDIEKELALMREGGNNSKHICAELEMCQERMNRLETVCNYLTSNLSKLHDNSSSAPSVDFTAEFALYSTALVKLKSRFEEMLRSTSTSDKATWTSRRDRRSERVAVGGALVQESSCRLASTGWHLYALFLLAVGFALAAWLTSSSDAVVNNWRSALGPHLDYVNGAPPM